MDAHVILTGSTGNLGSYLLDCLFNAAGVSKIYCLNRSANAGDRQASSQRARGLTPFHDHPKVEFIQCDLSQSDLGITPQTYTRLTANATHLIHNAWPVSFNLSFSSFEPQIRGVRNLINFTTRCERQTLLFFISTVSVVGRWGTLAGAVEKVPEVLIDDWRTAKMGYGQSKLVSERLVAEACKTSTINNAAICRVGQLGGPVRRGEVGRWNTNEWFPSLVKSSEDLGVVPADLGPMNNIDWVPIDICAEVVVELLLASSQPTQNQGEAENPKKWWKVVSPQQQKTASIYHIANPETVSYPSLLPVITKHISPTKDMQIVPFTQWVDRLKSSAKLLNAQANLDRNNSSNQHEWDKNPAAKLISFFDELQDKADRFPDAHAAKLDTTFSQSRSPTLANLQAIDEGTMRLWLRQWGYKDLQRGR